MAKKRKPTGKRAVNFSSGMYTYRMPLGKYVQSVLSKLFFVIALRCTLPWFASALFLPPWVMYIVMVPVAAYFVLIAVLEIISFFIERYVDSVIVTTAVGIAIPDSFGKNYWTIPYDHITAIWPAIELDDLSIKEIRIDHTAKALNPLYILSKCLPENAIEEIYLLLMDNIPKYNAQLVSDDKKGLRLQGIYNHAARTDRHSSNTD